MRFQKPSMAPKHRVSLNIITLRRYSTVQKMCDHRAYISAASILKTVHDLDVKRNNQKLSRCHFPNYLTYCSVYIFLEVQKGAKTGASRFSLPGSTRGFAPAAGPHGRGAPRRADDSLGDPNGDACGAYHGAAA